MTFDVGFGYYVDTILVTKFIPKVVVRIVASTYGVQVELLHNLNVLNHAFFRDNITAVRIQFMTVGSFEENRLAVYQYLGVLQFHLAETYLYRNHFVAAFQGSIEGI